MSDVQKFRKKPIVLEAEQFLPHEGKWPKGIVRFWELSEAIQATLPRGEWFIWNERGECYQRVENGDWIVHGISGCRYPVKKDIFPQIYEAV